MCGSPFCVPGIRRENHPPGSGVLPVDFFQQLVEFHVRHVADGFGVLSGGFAANGGVLAVAAGAVVVIVAQRCGGDVAGLDPLGPFRGLALGVADEGGVWYLREVPMEVARGAFKLYFEYELEKAESEVQYYKRRLREYGFETKKEAGAE